MSAVKEFWSLLRRFDLKGLFVTPSDNLILQMFRYVFVGGTAFVVDAGALWGLTRMGVNAYLAAAIAFAIGLVTNFLLSKTLVFTKENARVKGFAEFLSYAIIGVIGLGLTELLLFIGLEWLRIHVLAAKVIAAALVLVWNFAARKLLLYRHTDEKETIV